MADVSRARYPKGERDRLDRDVRADPDIRGSRSGRRNREEDTRTVAGVVDDPKRVERAWKKEGRG